MRSIAISLLVLSLVFLAACGGEENGTSETNIPDTPAVNDGNNGTGGTPAAVADTTTVVLDVEGMT